jgi:hypothetical protein
MECERYLQDQQWPGQFARPNIKTYTCLINGGGYGTVLHAVQFQGNGALLALTWLLRAPVTRRGARFSSGMGAWWGTRSTAHRQEGAQGHQIHLSWGVHRRR